MKGEAFLAWLRARPRLFKVMLVCIAGWAPVVMPRHPLVCAAIVISAAALFLAAVSERPTQTPSERPHDAA